MLRRPDENGKKLQDVWYVCKRSSVSHATLFIRGQSLIAYLAEHGRGP